LQEFLLEMGHGFCFVARQRRVTFDNEHYWIDLLLYNRRLKCLVALDLILGRFRHEYAGAMNFYLNYLKAEEMEAGENPPIGILLCSQKNETHMEYALRGMSNRIFVSRYLPHVPTKALDVKMKVFRAIKVLPRDRFRESDARRLLEEAQKMAQLPKHRNRVAVHHFKEGVTNCFLIMDFVAGGALTRMIAPGRPLPWVRAARYAAGVADALLDLHAQPFASGHQARQHSVGARNR
jgi:hypothetical protein